MKAIIASFRRGRKTHTQNHMIAQADSIENRQKAAALVGKNVSWKSPAGKEIKGKVASAHGKKGALRIIFEKGMPGQAVGTTVEIQ